MDFFKGRTNGFAANEYYSSSGKKVHENRPQSIFMCTEEEKILKPGVLSGSVCFSDSLRSVPWSEALTMPPSPLSTRPPCCHTSYWWQKWAWEINQEEDYTRTKSSSLKASSPLQKQDKIPSHPEPTPLSPGQHVPIGCLAYGLHKNILPDVSEASESWQWSFVDWLFTREDRSDVRGQSRP